MLSGASHVTVLTFSTSAIKYAYEDMHNSRLYCFTIPRVVHIVIFKLFHQEASVETIKMNGINSINRYKNRKTIEEMKALAQIRKKWKKIRRNE